MKHGCRDICRGLVTVLLMLALVWPAPVDARRRWVPKIAAAGGGGGGIGTQTQQDDFAGGDQNPLAGNWTGGTGEGDTFHRSSGSVTLNSGGDDASAFYTGTWGNDQFSAAKCTAGSGTSDGPGVCTRHASGAKTYYRLVIANNGTIELGKFSAGTYTSITTRSVTYAAGTELALSSAGTTHKIYYGGVQQGANVTDATIASGSPGIAYSSTVTGVVIDDWRGGTVP